MTTEDAVFEDIHALSDEAEALGLSDVAMVLEFALDVFLKETGQDHAPVTPAPATANLELSARKIEARQAHAPHVVPRISWTMDTFPLAHVDRKAS